MRKTSPPPLAARGPALASPSRSARRATVLLVAAGPAAFGLAFALHLDPSRAVRAGIATPLLLVALATLLGPALYVMSAWLDAAPSSRVFLKSWSHAVVDVGRLLLALAPSVAFLVASSQSPVTGPLLGAAGLAAAVCLALGRLHGALFRGARPAMHLLYTVWAAIALGIGARLFVEIALGVQL